MKHLFIHLKVQDGERVHDHKVLHTTNAENLAFAAERYVASYWGYGEHDGDWWWFNGEIAATLETYSELTEQEFEILNRFL
jgi:hypothetical protein